MPLVSVLMCVYNGEKYIQEAIQSVLDQTFGDFEFIIINDASNDQTENIILSFSDSRIIYFKNEKNLKLQRSLNIGLSYCRGKYIARMDADDICFPDRILKQVEYLNANPQISILGTGFEIIDSKGNCKQSFLFPSNPFVLKWEMCFVNPIVHPSVMARAEVIMDANGYKIEYTRSEDYELWCRLINRYKFSNLESVLLKLRKHESNSTLDYDLVLNQVVEISTRHISEILGHKVESKILYHFYNNKSFPTYNEVLQMCYLFISVRNKLIQLNLPCKKDIKDVNKALVVKIIDLIKPNFTKLIFSKMLLYCFYIDPVYFLRKIKLKY